MRKTITPPQGCKYRQIASFLHPSGAPFIDIYQAGAERTLGAVAPAPLIHRFQGSRAAAVPLHGLHPLHMSQIAPFDRHGAHPLRELHPVHHVHYPAPHQYGPAPRRMDLAPGGRSKVDRPRAAIRAPSFLRASAEFEFQCEVCGAAIQHQVTGRPRRYCSAACRQKAHRIRRALHPT